MDDCMVKGTSSFLFCSKVVRAGVLSCLGGGVERRRRKWVWEKSGARAQVSAGWHKRPWKGILVLFER